VPVRAMHMTKVFTYVGAQGAVRGQAGEWLIEDREGKNPRALEDKVFKALYAPCEPERPELIQPPDPAPPFEGPPTDPDKESI